MSEYICLTIVEALASLEDPQPEPGGEVMGARLVVQGYSSIAEEIDGAKASFMVANAASADIALICVQDEDQQFRVVAWASTNLVGAAMEWAISTHELTLLYQVVPVVRASKRGSSETDVLAALYAFTMEEPADA